MKLQLKLNMKRDLWCMKFAFCLLILSNKGMSEAREFECFDFFFFFFLNAFHEQKRQSYDVNSYLSIEKQQRT